MFFYSDLLYYIQFYVLKSWTQLTKINFKTRKWVLIHSLKNITLGFVMKIHIVSIYNRMMFYHVNKEQFFLDKELHTSSLDLKPEV